MTAGRMEFVKALVVLMVCCLAAVAWGDPPKPSHQRQEHRFSRHPSLYGPGDVLYADSDAALLKCDPDTGESSVISQGGLLVQPYGVALLSDGDAVVSDPGADALIRVDRRTGEQTLLAANRTLGVPFGMATDEHGYIWVVNGQALIRVDEDSGQCRVVSSRQLFSAPLGVAMDDDHTAYIADGLGKILRVNTRTGQQSLLSSGKNLINPIGIYLLKNELLIADAGGKKIVHVSTKDGSQTVLFWGGSLSTPVALAMYDSSHLLVGDPDAFSFAGDLLMIDMRTGDQTPLTIGAGDYVNPRCLVVVPGH